MAAGSVFFPSPGATDMHRGDRHDHICSLISPLAPWQQHKKDSLEKKGSGGREVRLNACQRHFACKKAQRASPANDWDRVASNRDYTQVLSKR